MQVMIMKYLIVPKGTQFKGSGKLGLSVPLTPFYPITWDNHTVPLKFH